MTDQQHTFALEFLRQLPTLPAGANVLDIGGGPGYQTQWMRQQGIDACSVDLSPPSVDVPWISADAHALPFPDGSIDAVWTHHAFEHFRDPLGALAEVNRVLRADGWLFFTVPDTDGVVSSGHINRYDMPLVIYHLAMCGFDTNRGHFGKFRSHLRAAVRKRCPADMETSVRALADQGRLPTTAAAAVRRTGRFDRAALVTWWLDGSEQRY
jgi:SAM-dependent methyltransferase